MPCEVNDCDSKRPVPIGGLCWRYWNVYMWSVVGLAWSGACLLNRLARVKCGLYTSEEDMAECDDGSPLLFMTLIVMSRHLRGSSVLGLMTLVYNRRMCFFALCCASLFALDHLCMYSSRVSSFASSELN